MLVPALLPLWFTDRGWSGAAVMVAINSVVLVVAYVVASYGLLPALRVGFVQAVRQVGTVTRLVARGSDVRDVLAVRAIVHAAR